MIFPVLKPDPEPVTLDFFIARVVANRIPSIRDATVRTPPTIAQVLFNQDEQRNV
jgi:hypothetical protein